MMQDTMRAASGTSRVPRATVWGGVALLSLIAAALPAAGQLVDYEDLTVGDSTTCGAPPLVSQGIPMFAEPFFFFGGGSTCNDATVSAGNVNGTQDLNLNNTNVRFLFPGAVTSLGFEYAWFGGNLNLRVNGQLVNVNNPVDLVGVWGFPALGQVQVNVGPNAISLTPVSGAIVDFAVGGQEFFIDNVRYQVAGGPCLNPTPPLAEVDEPKNGQCICEELEIFGTADDPDDGFAGYTLEYRALFDPTWTVFESSATPVVNGLLGLFEPAALGLPQGIYLIRLNSNNDCFQDEDVVIAVYYDSGLDELRLDAPASGDIVGRQVCFDGTVLDNGCFDGYRVGYRPAGSGAAFQPVDPANPSYTGSKINEVFATWDTVGLGIPDGDYEIQIVASTVCGFEETLRLELTVDNTAPIAEITDPTNCDSAEGEIKVVGTAFDEHIAGWTLQFTGGPFNTWQTIATGNTNVIDDVLGIWDTSNLPPCCYTLRLVVTDQAVLNCNPALRHRTEFEVSLSINEEPCPDVCDINGDGVVDFFDIDPFVECVIGPR
jgi:hypothetical protein